MAEQLDTIVLAADCPAKSKVLSIFGKRCAYLTSRCLIPQTYSLNQCETYMQHNKTIPRVIEARRDEPDEHATHMGIGACDIHMAARMYDD